ncbi:MAG: acetylornithine transaminase [Syntrophales bacterium]|jgi:predicted acetylornithine/succinylornithine family transaminase|nr:acetylornithine transaminase [Syntrophales bacterium]
METSDRPTEEWIALGEKYVMATYKRFPLALTHGSGMRLWDCDGKAYLDFIGGIAVCALGHCHPRVVEAIQAQAAALTHVSNLYHIPPQIELAGLLVENSFADKVFFCNSGAEANEGAIKLARKYGCDILGGKYEIIAMKNSFHGRTLATVTATGQEKFQRGFAPLPDGFVHVPFDDLEALENAVNEKTCAVLLEPIQAEGGVRVPRETYLQGVRRICDENNLLMILDEVQTGMGRTGKLFGHMHEGVAPDVMTLAKALGNGFPVGAMLATDRIASVFSPGDHASTFGGNPLAMAAGKAVFKILTEEGVIEKGARTALYLEEKLITLKNRHACIREIRGRGLLVGVELDREAAPIIGRCIDEGILIGSAGTHVLRFLPPLIVEPRDVDHLITTLDRILEDA